MDKLREVGPVAWLGLVLVVGLGVLTWHGWSQQTHPDESWLDADQPPLQVEAVPAGISQARARQVLYHAPTLRAWEHTWVGDA